jgi:hypothetical protein
LALRLDCPCGERITGETEDELVEKAQTHLKEKHPERAEDYGREEILALAF